MPGWRRHTNKPGVRTAAHCLFQNNKLCRRELFADAKQSLCQLCRRTCVNLSVKWLVLWLVLVWCVGGCERCYLCETDIRTYHEAIPLIRASEMSASTYASYERNVVERSIDSFSITLAAFVTAFSNEFYGMKKDIVRCWDAYITL